MSNLAGGACNDQAVGSGHKFMSTDQRLIRDLFIAHEERFMLFHEYPHYPEHKAEHERLLDEYTEFMTKFERDPNLGDREAIQGVLCQWIVSHILTSDKKMSLMVISAKQT